MPGSTIAEAFVKISPETSGFGSKLGSMLSGVLSNPIAGIAVAATAAGVALLDIGTKFQSSFNAIARGTGATGEQLNQLKGDFKNVLSNTAGSFQQVQDAIIGVSRGTGLTGGALDALSKQFVTLGRITKTDVAGNIAATEPLFAKFNVAAKDQGAALDILFKASQFSGQSVASLAGQVQSGTTALKGFGFTFAQSTALVAEFDKAGINSGAALVGMKTGFANIAKEGKDPQVVLANLVKTIKNAPTDTAAASAAMDVFGKKAGPELAAAIRSGRLDIDGLAKSLASGKDGIIATANATPTLAGAFAKLRNQILVAVEPAAAKMLELVTIIVGRIMPAFQSLIGFVGPIFKTLAGLWSGFMDGFKTGDDAKSLGIGGLLGTFINLGVTVKGIFGDIKNAWDGFINGFKTGDDAKSLGLTGIAGAFDNLGVKIRPIFDWIKTNIKPILIGLGIAFAALISPIAVLVGGLIYAYTKFQTFRDVVQAVAEFILNTVVPAYASFFGFIAKALTPLVETFISRWGEIQTVVSTVIRIVVDVVKANLDVLLAIWNVFHATILRVLVAVWDEVKLVVTTAINLVSDIIKLVLDVLTGHWSKAWNDLVDIVKNVWNLIGGTISNALSVIGNILGSLAGILLRAMEAALGAVVNTGASIVGWFLGLPGKILGALAGLGTDLFNFGVNVIKGFVNGLLNGVNAIGSAISGVGSSIWNQFKKSLGPLGKFLSPKTQAGVMIGQGFVLGMIHGLATMGPALATAASALTGKLSAAFVPAMSGPTIPGSFGAAVGRSVSSGGPVTYATNHYYNVAGSLVTKQQLFEESRQHANRYNSRNGGGR